jgi:arabinofuranan 3-O-arabinosyltransferase
VSTTATDHTRRLVRLGLVYAGLAGLALFADAPGWLTADTRFEHYWAGAEYLERHHFVWDDVRTLGGPSVYYSPVVAVLLAALDVAGPPPWVIERLVHTAYLTLGGLGMVELLRRFRPTWGPEHGIAGLLYVFSAYTSQFLVPSSGIFLHYALAPWLLVALVSGTRGRDVWRGAALFAVSVFAVGAINTATLLYVLVPLIPTALYLLYVERSIRWRNLVGWAGRAAGLTLAMVLPALLILSLIGQRTSVNLRTTELSETVSRFSSWTESWRGLGEWLTYLPGRFGPVAAGAAAYFDRPLVVAATFALPVGAALVLWRSRWRPRTLFASMILLSLVLMVGQFPVGDPPPLGRLIELGRDESLFLRSLRAGYKAGAGYAMGMAALLSVGFVGLAGSLRRRFGDGRSGDRAIAALGMSGALLLALVAHPFVTGGVYSDTDQVDTLPDYWDEALAWLDSQEGTGSVLVLPGTTRTRYRWGYLIDDQFDARLDRTHTLRSSLPQGTTETADLVVSLDDHVTSGDYEPGVLSAIAARLGVRWIVLRNDLDWASLGLIRPDALDAVRTDPSLTPVATFGDPSAYADDAVPASEREAELAPVEIFEVDTAGAQTRFVAAEEISVVSGDGDAWVGQARRGHLGSTPTLAYSASLSTDDLVELMDRGADVVITDTNRRRVTQVTSERNFESHTLAEDEELNRPPIDLFAVDGSQSVADFGDARRVQASAYGRPGELFQRWFRPANAFDGVADTAWVVGGLGENAAIIAVEFETPQDLDRIRLTPFEPARADTGAVEATVLVPSRPATTVDLDGGSAWVEIPGEEPVESLAVAIEALDPEDPAIGLSEIHLPGVDTVERIRLPDDLIRRAADDDSLAALVGEGGFTYRLERAIGAGPLPEELRIRRTFRTPRAGEYELEGRVRLPAPTDDDLVDQLLGGPIGAVGGSVLPATLESRAAFAVDGDPESVWSAPLPALPLLNVRFPRQEVESITLRLAGGDAEGAALGVVDLYTDPEQPEDAFSVDLGRDCEIDPDGACRIDVPRVTTDRVTLSFGTTTESAGQVEVAEVTVGNRWQPRPVDVPVATGCQDVVEIDGTGVPLRVTGSWSALLEGEDLPLRPCASVTLDAGWHTLDGSRELDGIVDWVDLLPTERRTRPPSEAFTAPHTDVNPAERPSTVATDADGFLLSGIPYHPGWSARAGTTDLGGSLPLDTMAAWEVKAGTSGQLNFRFGPQRWYELAMAVALAALAACVALLVRPARISSGPDAGAVSTAGDRASHAWAAPVFVGALSAVGYALSGLGGLAVSVAAAAAAWRRPRLVAGVAAATLGAMAVAALVEGGFPSQQFGRFLATRPVTEDLARLGGVLMLIATFGLARQERNQTVRIPRERLLRTAQTRWQTAAAAAVAGGLSLVIFGAQTYRPIGWLLLAATAVTATLIRVRRWRAF